MRKKRLAVLFGGCSSEYPVSLQSAYGVLTHLRPDRYEAVPVGITREGKWLSLIHIFPFTFILLATPTDTILN